MLELASLGAGVMHNRSIEFAKKFDVAIHVRSSLSDAPGTMIVADAESADQAVCGAALLKDEARISILGVLDKPGSSLEIFSRIAQRSVSVDMIVQNVGEQGKADVSFTVPKDELRATLEAVDEAAAVVGADQVTHDDNVSKVSVVGLGMAKQTGVADKMFHALADAGVNIQMITTSEIKISVLVARDQAQKALRAVHQVFNLHEEPASITAIESTTGTADRDAAAVIKHLRGADMEELAIDAIALDEGQARVSISGVPDTPGVAAKVFDEVAGAGIFVDMIVQSYNGHAGQASLSFTVPSGKLTESVEVANRLATTFKCKEVSSSPDIAKLSVSGVGLRSHTGVAIRAFNALASAGINVEMINTSEVRVNVVVDGKKSKEALTELQKAFADVLQ